MTQPILRFTHPNNWQTDERLLQNLALVMPKEIEGYKLMHVDVVEELA